MELIPYSGNSVNIKNVTDALVSCETVYADRKKFVLMFKLADTHKANQLHNMAQKLPFEFLSGVLEAYASSYGSKATVEEVIKILHTNGFVLESQSVAASFPEIETSDNNDDTALENGHSSATDIDGLCSIEATQNHSSMVCNVQMPTGNKSESTALLLGTVQQTPLQQNFPAKKPWKCNPWKILVFVAIAIAIMALTVGGFLYSNNHFWKDVKETCPSRPHEAFCSLDTQSIETVIMDDITTEYNFCGGSKALAIIGHVPSPENISAMQIKCSHCVVKIDLHENITTLLLTELGKTFPWASTILFSGSSVIKSPRLETLSPSWYVEQIQFENYDDESSHQLLSIFNNFGTFPCVKNITFNCVQFTPSLSEGLESKMMEVGNFTSTEPKNILCRNERNCLDITILKNVKSWDKEETICNYR